MHENVDFGLWDIIIQNHLSFSSMLGIMGLFLI